MRDRARRLMAFALALVAGATPGYAQDAVEKFFRGKTVTVIIPTAPGGGRVTNALPFLQHYAKHIPGNPTVVSSFMPGAGGSIGLNHLYNVAPRDGTVIVTPLASLVVAQMTGDKSVQYDVSKMKWIGRTTDAVQVLYVWHTSNVKTFGDARTSEVVVGSAGTSASATIIPLMMNDVFGTRFKIVQGYNGSGAFNLAVERGETDAAYTTWSNLNATHPGWVEKKQANVLVQVASGRHPDLPQVPLAVDLAVGDGNKALIRFVSSVSDLGQTFIAPPDVPADRLAALRRAFDQTMKDPEYLATTGKVGIQLNPMTGEELDVLVAGIFKTPADVIERYKKAVAVR